MSRTISRRLWSQSAFNVSAESRFLITTLQSRCLRAFSSTGKKPADGGNNDDLNSFLKDLPTPPEKTTAPSQLPGNQALSKTTPSVPNPPIRSKSLAANARLSPEAAAPPSNGLGSLARLLEQNKNQREGLGARTNFNPGLTEEGMIETREEREERPHSFFVYSTRHNTHITVGAPNGDALIHMSCGNLGFKHSARKHYDPAYQLASYVLSQMQNRGLVAQIRKMEVTLRGFGSGREAVTKALLGSEGKNIRGKIVKVSDATRLKFGGTRSPKPRRLG